ncbi:MAG: type II secretion system protein [Candidatus Scalindua sp.]|jgi:prepilin-type N-terminal cleavage/methylation domain-containing protein|nr:type II secretion system protein [Candidatus Scalindua sp.]
MTRIQSKTKNASQSTQNGEAGFTMIELVIVLVLTSILGIFVFKISTSSLKTLITMRTRKERADDAVLVLEKISREVRAANDINSTGSNILIFKRADTGKAVKYIRNTGTNRLRRQSAADVASLPGNNSSGNIVAENVSAFNCSSEAGSGSINRIAIDLQFADGSDWETKIYPRNYGL